MGKQKENEKYNMENGKERKKYTWFVRKQTYYKNILFIEGNIVKSGVTTRR